jgi:hypothetical protein
LRFIEPIASRLMRRRAPQANSGEGAANGVVGTVSCRATINRRVRSSADLRITRRLTHMSSPILTGASLDKAGASLPLPFETGRVIWCDFGRSRLKAIRPGNVKHSVKKLRSRGCCANRTQLQFRRRAQKRTSTTTPALLRSN